MPLKRHTLYIRLLEANVERWHSGEPASRATPILSQKEHRSGPASMLPFEFISEGGEARLLMTTHRIDIRRRIYPQLVAGIMASLFVATTIATGQTTDFSGSWKGTLQGPDGSSGEVQVDFSPKGWPLYSYVNNQGVERQTELSQVGQTVEYVPPGGGVQRVVVKSLEKGKGRLAVGIVGSFEKASQGYLDQRQEAAWFEYALVPEGLRMKMTTQSTSHLGDKDMIVGGNLDPAVAEGLLQKVP
jgi:hypothetical protein